MSEKINGKELASFFSTIFYCLSLSWKASKYYTTVRIAGQILTPVLTIVGAFVGKYLIDLLAGAWFVEDITQMLLLLFACLFFVALLRTINQKVQQYCQSMHNDLAGGKLALIMMGYSLAADLEYFDNPDYQDIMKATASPLNGKSRDRIL